MTVYALFRRGNYLLWLLTGLMPRCLMPKGGVARRVVRAVERDSWMESALYFTRRCGGTTCRLCHGRSIKAYHMLTVRATADQGVISTVDEVFDKPEAYLFVALPDISEERAAAFYEQIATCAYNGQGASTNFLPWPMTGSVGIGRDNHWRNATHLFCSEMIAAFLQTTHKRYEKMNLVPCRTTPQMLYNALVTSAECHNQQFVLRNKSLVRAVHTV